MHGSPNSSFYRCKFPAIRKKTLFQKVRTKHVASERDWRLPSSPIVGKNMCIVYVVVVAVVVVGVVAVDIKEDDAEDDDEDDDADDEDGDDDVDDVDNDVDEHLFCISDSSALNAKHAAKQMGSSLIETLLASSWLGFSYCLFVTLVDKQVKGYWAYPPDNPTMSNVL